MEMRGDVESDEAYVTAGLKGRNNSGRIMGIGRKHRRRGLRRRGERISQPSSSSLRGVVEKIIFPKGDVESETALKIIGRRVSDGEWVRGNATLTDARTGHHHSGTAGSP